MEPRTGSGAGGSPALRTDQYELTMLAAARRSGVAAHRAVFEVFARSLPPGRRYGVVGGTGRIAEAIAAFRFDDAQLAFLAGRHIVDPETLAWLAEYRFGGSIAGYAEGETYFPGSPICSLEGTFAETIVLETLVLSILNHDTAVASAAARMDTVAAPGHATHRDGDAPHARGRGGARGAGRVRRRIRRDVEPRSRPALRNSDGRDRRARLHARARDRARRVPGATAHAGYRHDPARRHLRHRRGHPHRGCRRRELGVDGPGAIRIDSGVLAGRDPTGTCAPRRARRDQNSHRRLRRPGRTPDRRVGARLRTDAHRSTRMASGPVS